MDEITDDEFEAAKERFTIMTENNDVTDEIAYEWIAREYGRSMVLRLVKDSIRNLPTSHEYKLKQALMESGNRDGAIA